MKAAVIYAPGDVKMVEMDIPQPKMGEVLIKIKACGVCGTDHSLFVGAYPANYPVIIGHEFSGTIAAVGEGVKNFKLGDRVTVDPNRVCHQCDYCRMGKEHLCANLSSMGVHIDGADAEYCVMVESNVYPIPDQLSFEEAAFCEPLACAVHGVELTQIHPGDTVLVLGAGGMGNLIAQLAARAGAANVIVSEPILRRRKAALENGATHVVDPFTQDVDAELRKIQKIGADVVFEVAGSPKLQGPAVYYARRAGTVMWFGCAPSDKLIEVNPFYVNDAELHIMGSYNNQFATGKAVKLLASRTVRVDNLISHNIALKDYLDVFKLFGGPDTIKLMVNMD
ncbi:MAG: zinc-dependent alcohol dehydrogenase family protein [Chloroflexi bacterium]|nr:zinc-dependent alcohol dehydrogenase family protein [Chloroflexota bacterium]